MNKKSCSIGQLVFGFYFFNRYSFVHSPTLRSGQAWQKAFEFHSEFFRAFSVFCGKILFGIQACIPRHCGRGKRGKRHLNFIQNSFVHSVFFVAKYYSAFIRAFPDTAVGAGVEKVFFQLHALLKFVFTMRHRLLR